MANWDRLWRPVKGKSYAIGLHISGPAQVYAHYTGMARAAFLTAASSGLVSSIAQPAPSTTFYPGSYLPYLRFTTALP